MALGVLPPDTFEHQRRRKAPGNGPWYVRSMEGLGFSLRLSAVHDLELLTGNWHDQASLLADADALTAEVCPMPRTPRIKRSVAFSLNSGELGTDVMKWEDFDGRSFNDAKRPACPIRDNAQISRLQ